MKVLEFLDLIYNRKKDGKLSHFAIKFLTLHNLKEDEELEIKQAIILSSNISNKDKRNNIIKKLVEMLEVSENINEPINLRNNSYKSVCKFYHPDNTETGNNNMFLFVQEVKEMLWEYTGKPRKNVENYGSWESEIKNKRFYEKYGKFPDFFDIDS